MNKMHLGILKLPVDRVFGWEVEVERIERVFFPADGEVGLGSGGCGEFFVVGTGGVGVGGVVGVGQEQVGRGGSVVRGVQAAGGGVGGGEK